MNCKNCGAVLDGGKFCPYCGTKIGQTEQPTNLSQKGISVVLLQKGNKCSIFYPGCIKTETYLSLNRCKREAIFELNELLEEYKEISDKDLLNDSYVKKMIDKGYKASIDFLEVDLEVLASGEYEGNQVDILGGYLNDDIGTTRNNFRNSSFDDDSFSDDEFYTRQDARVGRMKHSGGVDYREVHLEGDGVYAYVEKFGFSYEGDIPGLSFCRVSFADSYEDCIEKLQQNLNERRERSAFFEPPRQDVEKIRQDHPRAKIIKLY